MPTIAASSISAEQLITGSTLTHESVCENLKDIFLNHVMLISIGILAWNEEDVIEQTLISLFQQSVFQDAAADLPDVEWEIIVVPNGCVDKTAAIARQVLANPAGRNAGRKINCSVHELDEPGKSNAWNHYVHEFSDKQADLILMIDADIEFGETETISAAVKALQQNPRAVVAVDQPLKDVVRKNSKTLIERISVAASRSSTAGSPGTSGQFFCARANELRKIWMPKGLSVEDGFLHAMIVTDCFRSGVDAARIIRAENATHYFKTLTNFRDIFQHELRLVIGTALNCYLTWDFLLFATDPGGPGAGVLIRNWIENDPTWYSRLMGNAIRNHGFWVLPGNMLFRRFSGFNNNHGLGAVKWLVVATIGFLLDLPVFIAANHRLKKGGAIGYW